MEDLALFVISLVLTCLGLIFTLIGLCISGGVFDDNVKTSSVWDQKDNKSDK